MANKPLTDAERTKIIDTWLSSKDNSAKSLSAVTGISASRCDAVITKYLNEKIQKLKKF
jgi:hypothetical protein